ncbi:IclR family transcriptional regulator [Deferrisoma palaeochoriense]
MGNDRTERPYYKVGSLEKGLRILELLADRGELSVSEVARSLDLNRSAAHRFLATLRELQYVTQDPRSLRYRLSMKAFEIGNRVANVVEIREVARPYMRDLAARHGETVNLGFWDRGDVVHVDKVESRETLRVDAPIGSRVPAHTVALGKAILAFRPPEEQEQYLVSAKLEPRTPNTITNPSILRRELQQVRERGYAIDNEELCLGLRCVAAPVFDYSEHPAYAVSLSGPTLRMTDEKVARMQKDLKEVCGRLSRQLGARGE